MADNDAVTAALERFETTIDGGLNLEGMPIPAWPAPNGSNHASLIPCPRLRCAWCRLMFQKRRDQTGANFFFFFLCVLFAYVMWFAAALSLITPPPNPPFFSLIHPCRPPRRQLDGDPRARAFAWRCGEATHDCQQSWLGPSAARDLTPVEPGVFGRLRIASLRCVLVGKLWLMSVLVCPPGSPPRYSLHARERESTTPAYARTHAHTSATRRAG